MRACNRAKDIEPVEHSSPVVPAISFQHCCCVFSAFAPPGPRHRPTQNGNECLQYASRTVAPTAAVAESSWGALRRVADRAGSSFRQPALAFGIGLHNVWVQNEKIFPQ
jgi:hypothetical protein